MAVTLQPDPTLAGFNAYCSKPEANEFLLERRLWGTDWEACANKDAAIMWATRELNRLNYVGSPAVSGQRHAWPRSNVPDVGSTEIPDEMKDATAELSLYLSTADRTKPSANEDLAELKLDVITLKFRESPTGRELTSEMPDSVRGLLKKYLAGGASASGVNRKAVRA